MNVHKRLVLATAAVALSAGLAGTVPAHADQPSVSAQAATQRRDVCFTGACGSATVTFKSHYSASVSMSVADNHCDAHPAKVRILADQYSASHGRYTWHGPWHVNHRGCHGGTGQPWNSTFAGGDPLLGMKVEICNDGVKCRTSSEMYNPY
ncbi:hypothetical protein OHB00_02045 [Streptomyces sp. NBC_00631]|uniref:hypothetical protein n=1 Tax=Streptomyces sp. NBC_00631 TaxID=2975793 RepID=UPI0030E51E5A